MYLRKRDITIATTGASGTFNSTWTLEYPLYAVHFQQGSTIVSSTAAIVVKSAASEMTYVSRTASTGDWLMLPRQVVATTTGNTVASTSYNNAAYEQIPAILEKITVTVADATSTGGGQGATVTIYEGG